MLFFLEKKNTNLGALALYGKLLQMMFPKNSATYDYIGAS
jgi:hypothetical protein